MSPDERLTIQTGWYWDAEFIGYFIATARGFDALQRIQTTYLEGGPDVTPERTVLNGTADVAITVRDTTLAMIAEGADLEIVGLQYRHDPLAVLVPSGSPVTDLTDLAGCRVAVPEVSRSGLCGALLRAGVDPPSVRMIPFDGAAEMLRTGAVDAVVGYVTTLPLDLADAGVTTRVLPLSAPAGQGGQNLLVARRSRSPQLNARITRWRSAAAQGWRENAIDPARYPRELRATWFAHTGRSLHREIEHNVRQIEFMGDPRRYLLPGIPPRRAPRKEN